MKTYTACAGVLAAIAALPGFAIADSQDVRITGIIQPRACVSSIVGAENLNYGEIDVKDLQPDAYTVLQERQAGLQITCAAATKFAFIATNDQPNTLAGGDESTSGFGLAPVTLLESEVYAAGLGLQEGSGAKIGGFTIKFGKAELNGSQGVNIRQDADTSNPPVWKLETRGMVFYDRPMRVSWGVSGSIPAAIQTLNVPLRVQPYINKASSLSVAQPITLAGKVGIEMIYL